VTALRRFAYTLSRDTTRDQNVEFRWASEIFHEFGKQAPGLEAAQVRKEEVVTRHFCLRGVAQSLL
jgi:hypothetical protein